MKLRHFIEVIVVYVALAAINLLLFPQYPGFVGVDPSPYWIGVLLFGFRYGVVAGLMSGLASASLYLAMAWLGIERYQFEDISFYILPALFVIVGVLIGVGVYQYREIIRQLKGEKSVLEVQLAGKETEVTTLTTINSGLEKRIVTRMQTLVTLYEGALSLGETELDVLYRAILKFVSKTLQAESAAIYVKVDDGWRLKESIGWKEYERHLTSLKPREGLTGLAGSGNKIVTIRDFVTPNQNEDILADAVMAGPIHAGEKGEVVAVLSIQDIPFLQFSSASVNLFSFLLDWASRSLGRAKEMETLKEGEIWDSQFNVFSHRYFEQRAGQEWIRSKTYYLPLSMGLVEVLGLDTLSKDAEEQLLLIVAQVLRESCREMDVVARYPDPGIPFAFLLITASATQAAEIQKKILNNFEKLQLGHHNSTFASISIKVGLSNFTPQVPNIDAMNRQAMESLHATV
ncbi:MAG: hypothetical protein COV45_02370 [Deltaproteobacteria bacterium CG11_big_fil_rev_8_21_14_0_20_47_16]|nr:MAG: hypothetical protein COV45_02370 [Deltaproteobacteria bacterium CG11_big_fil_rev_8_21_14_0_20_47_16]